ncbi:hypothetical protein [Biformimicrobium ophioploci]|nr:hypothetical protein [Microbulbifer sp. NKW57]
MNRYPLKMLLFTLLLPAVSGALAQEDDWGEWGEELDGAWQEESAAARQAVGLPLHGFVEQSFGVRTERDPLLDDETLADSRLRLEWSPLVGEVQFKLKGDLWYDSVIGDWEAQAREASIQYAAAKDLDIKFGRQTLTWGTGDFLFINDQFAKDWQAFFSGRDDQYLKAPQDAIRASFYGDSINAELVWMPRFKSDEFIRGERFSFFSPQVGQQVAPGFSVEEPAENELAARLFWQSGSTEYAVYGYNGHQGTPDISPVLGAYFPELVVAGASLRRPFFGGLFNTEWGYFDNESKPDQWRVLLGYERELFTNFTASGQAYLEHYAEEVLPKDFSVLPEYAPDRSRTVLTTRLSYRAMQEKLTWTLFAFHSPSDRDGYLRPSVSWRQSDEWQWTLGGNIYHGDAPHTFFGQFDRADNAYIRLKFSF